MFSRIVEKHLEAIVVVAIFTALVIMAGLGNALIDGLGV